MTLQPKYTANVQTTDLVQMLGILNVTASRKNNGDFQNMIEIGTRRGPFGDEPGDRDLLVGLSFTSGVAGSWYTECVGEWDQPILITSGTARVIMGTLASVVNELETPEDHFVTLAVMEDDADSSLVLRVFAYTTPGNDPDDPTDLQVRAFEHGSFGGAGYASLVHGAASATVEDSDGNTLDSDALTCFDPKTLVILSKVAKLVKASVINVYQVAHAASTHQVVIGRWVGALQPIRYGVDASVDSADADIYTPEDPSRTGIFGADDDDDGDDT